MCACERERKIERERERECMRERERNNRIPFFTPGNETSSLREIQRYTEI